MHRLLIATLFFFIMFGYSQQASAVIYTFKDANGVVHFTNVPTDSRYKPLIRKPHRPKNKEAVFDRYIRAAGRLYNIDPLLIKAIIKTESNFDSNATSHKGASGLMQLMPGTAKDMNVTDLFDPQENIFGGTKYLRWLSKIFEGDLELILASYNAGPERVKSTYTIPNIRETKNYVKLVLSNYRKYKNYK